MNNNIMRSLGFGKEVALKSEGFCPFCKVAVNPATDFRDESSRKEFGISGLCQADQDKMFGVE